MLLYFLITWWIFALIDAGATWYTIRGFRILYPKTDHTLFERNYLPRFFIRKLDLNIGIMVHSLFMIIIIFIISYSVYMVTTSMGFIFGFGFIVGMYLFLLVANHLSNIRFYRFIVKTRQKVEMKNDIEEFLKCSERRIVIINKIKNKIREK